MQTASPRPMNHRLRLFLLTLVIGMAVFASHAVGAHANPTEYYECKSPCASINGSEMWLGGEPAILYNRAANLSGKGVCSKAWVKLNGAWHEHTNCTETGVEVRAERKETNCESKCEGHGEVERWFDKYTYYLWGEEVNN